MIKLEEKDIRGQLRNCSGWIWPASHLRQHLQSSPLENRVMCRIVRVLPPVGPPPPKPRLYFTLQNVCKSGHTESLKAAQPLPPPHPPPRALRPF